MSRVHFDAVLFTALTNITRGLSRDQREIGKEIHKLATVEEGNNLKLADFEITYLGEFYERATERGIKITDTRFATMALFFGLFKNSFQENDFNDYQIVAFENEVLTRGNSIETPIMEFAKFLMFSENNNQPTTSYLDKLSNNANLEDLFIILSCLNGVENVPTIVKVLKEMQFLLETKDMVNDENYRFFQKILAKAHKYMTFLSKEKELKTINTYLKGIDGKLTQKGVVKALSVYGFSETNIEALNCLLKLELCSSPLKRQKQVVSFLQFAKSMTNDFDEFEKNIIKKIMGLGEFSVKMEAGAVTSLRKALSYYDILVRVKNTNNFIFLAKTAIEATQIVENNLFVNILEEEDFYTRLTGVSKNLTFYSYMFEENLKKIIYHYEYREKEEDVTIERVEKINLLIKKFETAFDMKLLDIWSSTKNAWSNTSLYYSYRKLCDNKIFNALELLTTKSVERDLSIEYFKQNNCHDKIASIKFYYEDDDLKAIDTIFSKWFSFREHDALIVKDATPEEMKNYFEIISEVALLLSISRFKNFFFNLMIMNSHLVKEVYNEKEIQELYKAGLSLAATLEDSGYYSSRFLKTSTISSLISEYMSDEEKARVKAEKEAQEAEEKRKELERYEMATIATIENIKNQNDENKTSSYGLYYKVHYALGYNDRRTNAFKKFRLKMLEIGTCKKDELDDFFELVGSLIKNDVISIEKGKALISNLQIFEEVEDVEEKIA